MHQNVKFNVSLLSWQTGMKKGPIVTDYSMKQIISLVIFAILRLWSTSAEGKKLKKVLNIKNAKIKSDTELIVNSINQHRAFSSAGLM